MKLLYLIRHAKSSWKFPEISDLERPLNERGNLDAPLMAAYLREKQIEFELMLSSPARRTLLTSHHFAHALNYPTGDIQIHSLIYEATPKSLLSVIQSIPETYNNVALFCHNPSITLLTNQLTNSSIENIPTCGIACIEFGINDWGACAKNRGILKFLITPKSVKASSLG